MMQMHKVVVTPKKATQWLKNSPGNRKTRMDHVMYFVRMIREGKWKSDNPQGIILDEDRKLMDGHHRLHAVVKSGKPVRMIVISGAPRGSVGSIIDTGKRRSAPDVATLLGINGVTHAMVATARRMKYGPGFKTVSNDEIIDVVQKYRPEIEFAVHFVGNKEGRSAPVKAVIARALIEDPSRRKKLERFCDVMRTQFAESPSEHAAVTLSKYLAKVGYSHRIEMEIDHATETCLDRFLRGRGVQHIPKWEHPIFPLVK